jgi:MFS family permease
VPSLRPPRPFGLFLAAGAVLQVIAWGATYYLPSILEKGVASGLGLGRDLIFGGVTVMLLIGALLSPAVGRMVERHGARWPLVAGAVLLAFGLTALGSADGLGLWLIGWAIFGLALPLGMSLAVFAAIAQTYPDRARKGITIVMLFGGLSNGVMWPLMGVLDH